MRTVSKPSELDDPVWDYILATKLTPYLDAVRMFWQNIDSIAVDSTGVHNVDESYKAPPGLMYRVTNTPVRSPIKGIQAFPFVPTTYLGMPPVVGGAVKMINRVCADNAFKLEEFTVIEKSNLPSTYHQGQFVAFVPTSMLENPTFSGKWVYLKREEMVELLQGIVSSAVQGKLIKYV